MVRSQETDGVFAVTLDRADRGNALSAEMVEQLIAAVDRALALPRVHTLQLRGAGAHFCTGFDLGELETSTDGDLLQRFVRIEALLAALWHAPLRTVAVARGRTWGAGADIFVACDERIATTDGTFRFPGATFGIVLGTRRLAERVGTDLARAIVTHGRQLDVEAALAAGLASEVCAADALEDRLARLQRAPSANRETVAALHAATRADLRDADLASLVRSAARPGLKERLLAYRQAQRAARSASSAST